MILLLNVFRSISHRSILSLIFCFCAIPFFGQKVFDHQYFRDSTHRYASGVNLEKLVCRFTYSLNSSVISETMGNNARELAWLDGFIRYAQERPNRYIESITLIGYSSIDGSYRFNETLSRERVEGFHQYLRANYPALFRYPHHIAWVGEDWKGFTEALRESNISGRKEILEIINRVRDLDEREQLIRKLDNGRPYREMTRHLLPNLRRVEIELKYSDHPIDTSTIKKADLPPTTTSSTKRRLGNIKNYKNIAELFGICTPATNEDADCRLRRFAVKTNTLLWAGIMPDFKSTTSVANLALEYYINDCWSVELGGAYSYWHYNNKQEFQGISGYRIEPRYRFQTAFRWMETFLGFYTRFGDYDIRTLNSLPEEETNNNTGKYWDVGLSTGIHLHLISDLGLEIGARAGYVRNKNTLYTPEDGERWIEDRKPSGKIKVTDLNISLVYRF